MHTFTEDDEQKHCPRCKREHTIDELVHEGETNWWLNKMYVSKRCECGYELIISQTD